MDEINDETGFANGDKFTSEDDVRAYFTPENIRDIFGAESQQDSETLTRYADLIIKKRWHCDF